MLIRTVKNSAFKSGNKHWNRNDEFTKVYNWGADAVEEVENDNSYDDVNLLTVETVGGLGRAVDKWHEDATKAMVREYRRQANCQFSTGIAVTTGITLCILAIVNLFVLAAPVQWSWAFVAGGAVAIALVAVRFNELRRLAYEAGIWSARSEQVKNLNRRLAEVQQYREKARANRAQVVRFMRRDIDEQATSCVTDRAECKPEASTTVQPKLRVKETSENLNIAWSQRPDAEQAQAWTLLYSRMTKVHEA